MILNSLRVGFFLALRYIRRASIWTTLLIIFVMLLTFLNVIFIRGILVGLPEGASISYSKEYSGDVIISTLEGERYIEQTGYVENLLNSVRGVEAYSMRYIDSGSVEANYKEVRNGDELPDQVRTAIVGIDPENEDAVTNLASRVIEGEYLEEGEYDKVLLGNQLIDRFTVPALGTETLEGVFPGDTVRISLNGNVGLYTVKGIVKSKVGAVSGRAYMLDTTVRSKTDRYDQNVDEIAIALSPGIDVVQYRDELLGSGAGAYGQVQTADESQGKFLEDIRLTFEILGNIMGVVGVIVASITIFIVIFVYAIARKKQIGILKGIGITHLAIESSYVFLSIFYAVIGISLGIAFLYLFLMPYVNANPIDFPFSDGILVAAWDDTYPRIIIIVVATLIAGYLPARMIVKKNTINAILGR